MAAENTIVDWALQFYCTIDDQEMVDDLLRLKESQLQESASPPGLHNADKQPLHLVFYKLRQSIERISPSCLGLDESSLKIEENKPWASPLNLQGMAKPKVEKSFSGSGSETLEPFFLPTNKRKQETPKLARRSSKRRKTGANNEPVDLAETIYLLIVAENARRFFAAEFLSKKQSQGSVADQSERWQHRFAKRNLAAETHFENVLVALKELVVLQAIGNINAVRTGDLKQNLDYIASKGTDIGKLAYTTIKNTAAPVDFDASYCLAILNMLFPVNSLYHDRRHSLSTNKVQQRYAFPLRHVHSPRVSLHKLICVVEAWVNGDEKAASSISGRHSALAGQKKPNECPTWLASVQKFAWSQLKHSSLSYLNDTQQNIAEHHRKIISWSSEDTGLVAATDALAVSNKSPVHRDMEDVDIDTDADTEPHKLRIAEITHINNKLLKDVDKQLSSDSTVIERISCHSQLVNLNLSTRAVYKALSKK
ncbi:hypothetical protein H4R99_003552 [Coemansia sp. RSA 1722]|nr:hypothetical protein IWW45_005964 [Coemansia sp. RSA 485]KAJ2599828.1 hypothetical protein H4R99_003552 [Coemansia sp. RSA 1722]